MDIVRESVSCPVPMEFAFLPQGWKRVTYLKESDLEWMSMDPYIADQIQAGMVDIRFMPPTSRVGPLEYTYERTVHVSNAFHKCFVYDCLNRSEREEVHPSFICRHVRKLTLELDARARRDSIKVLVWNAESGDLWDPIVLDSKHQWTLDSIKTILTERLAQCCPTRVVIEFKIGDSVLLANAVVWCPKWKAKPTHRLRVKTDQNAIKMSSHMRKYTRL